MSTGLSPAGAMDGKTANSRHSTRARILVLVVRSPSKDTSTKKTAGAKAGGRLMLWAASCYFFAASFALPWFALAWLAFAWFAVPWFIEPALTAWFAVPWFIEPALTAWFAVPWFIEPALTAWFDLTWFT